MGASGRWGMDHQQRVWREAGVASGAWPATPRRPTASTFLTPHPWFGVPLPIIHSPPKPSASRCCPISTTRQHGPPETRMPHPRPTPFAALLATAALALPVALAAQGSGRYTLSGADVAVYDL